MAALNASRVVDDFRIVSWTKDSILLRWSIPELVRTHVAGYKIRYQAQGSTVVQFTHKLDARQFQYDITQLHENTNYDVCIHVLSSNVSTAVLTQDCIKASTTTDSLHVALGSTFGAFLALGIIVMFVFLAKWQHTRKLKRQLQQVTPSVDSYDDSIVIADGEIEMSDVSLQQLPDDEVRLKMEEALAMNGHPHHVHCDGLVIGGRRATIVPSTEARKSSQAIGGMGPVVKGGYPDGGEARPLPPPPSRHRDGRSMSLRQQQQKSFSAAETDSGWYTILQPPPTSPAATASPGVLNSHIPPDVRPKDVRPKDVRPKDTRRKSVKAHDSTTDKGERTLLDLTSECSNQSPRYAEVTVEQGPPIRPNLSCNW